MNEKDIFNGLHDMPDEIVEDIAEKYPALDKEQQERLVELCISKSDKNKDIDTDKDKKKDYIDDEGELVVSGTEKYKRPTMYRFAASVAAVFLLGLGCMGIMKINRDFNVSDDTEEGTVYTTSITETTATTTTTARTTATTVTTSTTTEKTTETTAFTPVVTQYAPVVTTTETTTTTTTTATTTTTTATTTTTTDKKDEHNSTTTQAVCPVGYYKSYSNERERYWNFYSDGSGGAYVFADTGMGLAFTLDANKEDIMFHFASAENNTPAILSWNDDNTFWIEWTDSGETEYFEPDTEKTIDQKEEE